MPHISISTSAGKTIALEVDQSDSVHQIKQKISYLEGIPSDQQKLIFAGTLLDDLKTISEFYNNESQKPIFTLELPEITVSIKCIGESNVTVPVYPFDTIQNLKSKISDVRGISPDDITLSFKGKKLENNSATITSYGLKDKALLLMVKKPSKQVASTPVPPKLCLNNCGFYGQPATKDYCSKCYKDLGLAPAPSPSPLQNNNNNSNDGIISKDSESVESESNKPVEEEKPSDKTPEDPAVCWKCKRKVGVFKSFECRCKHFFCDKHRYHDLHNCTFDYTQLSVKLDKVVEPKIEEI